MWYGPPAPGGLLYGRKEELVNRAVCGAFYYAVDQKNNLSHVLRWIFGHSKGRTTVLILVGPSGAPSDPEWPTRGEEVWSSLSFLSVAWKFGVSVCEAEVQQKELLDLDSENVGRVPALPHFSSVTLGKLLKFYDPHSSVVKWRQRPKGLVSIWNEVERRTNILLSIFYMLVLFSTFLIYKIK